MNNDMDSIVHEYGDMLFRICLVYLRNDADAEDALQDTFIKYMLKAPEFKDSEHLKAWLITVAANTCKDILKSKKYFSDYDISAVTDYTSSDGEHEALKALLMLPDKYRLVLELYYVEGYRVGEIAAIISKSVSAVKMRLKRGRELLEKKYLKEFM